MYATGTPQMTDCELNVRSLLKHMQTRTWLESCIRYQEQEGLYTYCDCRHCGKPSRGGCCVECYRKMLIQLDN